MRHFLLVAGFALILAPTFCNAQSNSQLIAPSSTPRLTVESIYGSEDFRSEAFFPNWDSEGSQFIRDKPSTTHQGAVDLVSVEPRSNQSTLLVSATELIPSGKEKPLEVADHQWSADKNLVLIFTNTKKVWRHNSRGDYWLLNRAEKTLRQLGSDRPAASLMFSKLSPDGKSVAYVSDSNVYVEDVASSAIQKITQRAAPEIINGTSDWVYEEEFDLKDCFRWSPDSQKIAFWEFDTSEVGEFTLINNTDSLYPTLRKFKHTKPGQKNSAVRVGIVNLSDSATTWLDIPGDQRDNYIARCRWISENQLMLQQLNREQNRNSVLLADATTGATRQLFQDVDDAWVETCDDVMDINDGKQFLWISEKDGWRHVYLVDYTTGEMKLVTPGDFDVVDISRVTNDLIYFIASPQKPTERYLYRVPIQGGPATRVTPPGFGGWNVYDVSADGTVAVHSFSKFGQPPVESIIELPSHQIIRQIVDNGSLVQKLAERTSVETNFLRVGVSGGVLLDAWLMKPANFDPSRKYPLIVYVYGEPWGTTVNNSWGGKTYMWHRMLAEQGYAVCSIDNRGTKVPRGRDFRKSVYRQVGVLPAQDQAAAVRALTGHFSWLDSDRVGVWGWSGGGSMTLNALFRYPDIYKTGVAVAPVPDMMYYDSIYQERYMGVPGSNPEGYQQGSPIHFAKNLTGNLLIIHGTGDDNCHYQTIELLINELVKQDKQFSMMAYPNRSHSISEGDNTTVHLRKLMNNYFLENLPPGAR